MKQDKPSMAKEKSLTQLLVEGLNKAVMSEEELPDLQNLLEEVSRIFNLPIPIGFGQGLSKAQKVVILEKALYKGTPPQGWGVSPEAQAKASTQA